MVASTYGRIPGAPAVAGIPGDRRYRLLAGASMAFAVAYTAASIAGAPSSWLSVTYYVPMAAVPIVAYLAHRTAKRHPEVSRQAQLWGWLKYAAYLWAAGSFLWLGYYLNDPHSVFGEGISLGPWDAFIDAGYICALIGVVSTLRDSIHFRLALADAVVLGGAGFAALGAFVNHGLENGVTPDSLVTLFRPFLGILLLVLIAAAAAGARGGVPLSTALIGLGQVFLYTGSLVYAYGAVQNHHSEDRWSDMFYATGACVAICAGLLVAMRVDRPVFARSTGIPGHPAGSRIALTMALGAAAVSAVAIGYGYSDGSGPTVVVGCVAVIAIVAGGWLRTRSTYAALEAACAERDAARLSALNERQALIDLLGFVNDEVEERFRDLLDEAGSTLANAVREYLEEQQSRDDSGIE
jgi:hypothetical protein